MRDCFREAKCFWLKVGFLLFVGAGLGMICAGWLRGSGTM